MVDPPGQEVAGLAESRERAGTRGPVTRQNGRRPSTLEVAGRHSRFTYALGEVVRRPSIGLSDHQMRVWDKVRLALISEGWEALSGQAGRQKWWYRIAIHLLAEAWIEEHVETCRVCADLEPWRWLYDRRPSAPKGQTFSLAAPEAPDRSKGS